MGESPEKRASSPGDSKEKSSLLDFDVGKDFLSSWKPTSGAEDDLMDLDFGPVTKNRKKKFDFDKMDIDFNLDSNFGNLSSFNIDMSDLEVSSPLKKIGKRKEQSKEASGDGKKKGKTDSFEFSFDFNELDRFTFQSTSSKDKNSLEDQDKGGSPGRDNCQGSRQQLTEEKGILVDGISEKPKEAGALSTSSTNSQLVDGSHFDPINEDLALKSFTNDNSPSSLTTTEKVASQKEETLQQKLIPNGIQQTDCKLDKTNSAGTIFQEAFATEPLLDITVKSASQADTSSDTSELLEGVGSMATNLNLSIEEQYVRGNATADSGSNCGKLELEKLPPQRIASSQISHQHKGHVGDTNIPIDNTEGIDHVQDDAHSNQPSMSSSSQMPHSGEANEAPILELPVASLSRSIVDSAIPGRGKEAPVTRSKYFAGLNKTVSEFQKSSSSETKLTSVGSKRILTTQPRITVQTRSQASPSSLTKQDERPTSTNSENLKTLLPNVASIQLVKSTLPEREKVSPVKTVGRMPNLMGMKTSSSMEANINYSRPMIQKETKSLGSIEFNSIQHGKTPSKVSQLADPLRPKMSNLFLKRKPPEAPYSDRMMLNPSKQRSDSPGENRNTEETSVDEEDCAKLAGYNAKSAEKNCHVSLVDIPPEVNMKGLEFPYKMEDDSNIEQAEGLSKELEDISNMLRKKHEEAKELQVRAIVNNNKLLMLNHPLYDDKIRIIQKFAAGLKLAG